MTQWTMDMPAIKEAAEEFMQALQYWKSEYKVRKVASIYRPEWEEEDIIKSVRYNEALVNPVIKAFKPIYEMAQAEVIDEPFAFNSYMTGQVGRVLGDELSYPEITEPFYKLVDLFKGGLETREFWETDYYKKHLLPKNFAQFQVKP